MGAYIGAFVTTVLSGAPVGCEVDVVCGMRGAGIVTLGVVMLYGARVQGDGERFALKSEVNTADIDGLRIGVHVLAQLDAHRVILDMQRTVSACKERYAEKNR